MEENNITNQTETKANNTLALLENIVTDLTSLRSEITNLRDDFNSLKVTKNNLPKMEGNTSEKDVYDKKIIESFSKIPEKKQLIAMIASTIIAPIQKIATILQIYKNNIPKTEGNISNYKTEQNQQDCVIMFRECITPEDDKMIKYFDPKINQLLNKFLSEKNKNETVPKSVFLILLHEINSRYFQDEAVKIEIERIDKSELDYFKNYEANYNLGEVIDYRFLGKEQKIIIREFLIELYNLYLPESPWVEKTKAEREDELIRKEENRKKREENRRRREEERKREEER